MAGTGTKSSDKEVIKDDVVTTATQEQPQKEEGSKEPMISLSEVEALLEKKLAERMAQQPVAATPVSQSVFEKKLSNLDDIPELRDFEIKDRIYVLVDGSKPPSFGIRTRHKALSPLQYYNSETKTQHSLRFATNMVSFFMDKQEGDALTPHISIKNGIMRVSKEESNLQRFLHIHPDKDKLWKEFDISIENKKFIDEEDMMFDAKAKARDLKYTALEAVARVLCPTFDDVWDSSEVKAQVYRELAKNPAKFLRIANDPSIEIKGNIKTALKRGIIAYSNFKFISDKGDILLEVPRNEDELDAFVAWIETNKGNSYYAYIKGQI